MWSEESSISRIHSKIQARISELNSQSKTYQELSTQPENIVTHVDLESPAPELDMLEQIKHELFENTDLDDQEKGNFTNNNYLEMITRHKRNINKVQD